MFRGSVVSKLKRVGCGLVGVLAIAFGLFHPQHAYSYSYRNWFGGLVFGPVIAVLGAVAVLAAIFNWRTIWDSPPAVHTGKKL
jgi:1,4-dihydroxy-2-naphthoate octaprenyltransferase